MNVGRWVVRRKVTVFDSSRSRQDLISPCKSRHQEEAVTESRCHTSIMRRTSSSTRLRSPSPPTSVTVTSRRSEEHTSELQSRGHLVCRLLLEKKKEHKIRTLRDRHEQRWHKW